jgi:hypothetical protein
MGKFGSMLRDRRETAGLTQEDLAARLGVSRATMIESRIADLEHRMGEVVTVLSDLFDHVAFEPRRQPDRRRGVHDRCTGRNDQHARRREVRYAHGIQRHRERLHIRGGKYLVTSWHE